MSSQQCHVFFQAMSRVFSAMSRVFSTQAFLGELVFHPAPQRRRRCGEGLKTRSPKNVCVGDYTASNSDVTLVGIIELFILYD